MIGVMHLLQVGHFGAHESQLVTAHGWAQQRLKHCREAPHRRLSTVSIQRKQSLLPSLSPSCFPAYSAKPLHSCIRNFKPVPEGHLLPAHNNVAAALPSDHVLHGPREHPARPRGLKRAGGSCLRKAKGDALPPPRWLLAGPGPWGCALTPSAGMQVHGGDAGPVGRSGPAGSLFQVELGAQSHRRCQSLQCQASLGPAH
ncbi:staphylococcal nuclease domain-containing protein 1 [Platysternon megacephalum]|uniref:Staphylococcal nuclease domain-containing protein 1 n=1 Tax=Platysternon megacephalum TaxID=55544 RepID=A0A4D9DZ22_9SAUR|nr:staphylococcal nuclease domain-containing protein 1 [Platysternon megacephalum]